MYRVYAVIVVWGDTLRKDARRRRRQENNNRSPSEIIASMGGQLPPPYPGEEGNMIYTAAVWNKADDVPDMFVVGVGSVTTGPDGKNYTNGRLAEGTRYGVFNYIQLESDIPVSLTLSSDC